MTLLVSHKRAILLGNQLDDAIVSLAQKLLKKQFPNINGLQNSILQAKTQVNSENQVVHCCGNHWILASTVHDDSPNRVIIYYSLYDNITLTVICGLFGPTAMPDIVKVQKQHGTADCGVFVIGANCFKQELVASFNQGLMCHHLIQCLEEYLLTIPTSRQFY